MNKSKLVYRPVGLVAGAVASLVAEMLFRQVWTLAAGEPDAPDALDQEHSWGEILASAALQGAIFALVKAAVDRGTASAVQKLTGDWPA
jgi:Protein of unknown function (DUF4235)